MAATAMETDGDDDDDGDDTGGSGGGAGGSGNGGCVCVCVFARPLVMGGVLLDMQYQSLVYPPMTSPLYPEAW